MSRSVYLLQHSYECGEEGEYDVIRDLGVFETREQAEKALRTYIVLPGFCDYDEKCFSIDKVIVGRRYWEEGFIVAYY